MKGPTRQMRHVRNQTKIQALKPLAVTSITQILKKHGRPQKREKKKEREQKKEKERESGKKKESWMPL